MKNYFFVFVLFIFAGCSTVRIGYDYDKQADFSKFKTYILSEETLKMSGVNQLNRDRIIRAVENELAAKGFTKSESADVIVDVRVKGEEVRTATATTSGGYGYPYWRWGYGGGFSTTHVNYNKYMQGTIFVTIIDKASGKIAWQGTGTRTLDENISPEKREQNIDYAVNQIFTNYPHGVK